VRDLVLGLPRAGPHDSALHAQPRRSRPRRRSSSPFLSRRLIAMGTPASRAASCSRRVCESH
jgi:hypothetical protein